MTTLVTTIMTAMHGLFSGVPIADTGNGMHAIADTILAEGSNGYGRYIQFGDGTMICVCTPSAITTTSGTMNYCFYQTILVTFPASFMAGGIALGGISVSVFQDGAGGTIWSGGVESLGFGVNYAWVTIMGDTISAQGRIGVTAVGKWK